METASPELEFWLNNYDNLDTKSLEGTIREDVRFSTSAEEYIYSLCKFVRTAVVSRTANLAESTSEANTEESPVSEASDTSFGAEESSEEEEEAVSFKVREGGVGVATNPQAIRAQLGSGRPLDSIVQSRMESAFDQDFSQVNVHTDTKAAELSAQLNARAFTIERDTILLG